MAPKHRELLDEAGLGHNIVVGVAGERREEEGLFALGAHLYLLIG